MLNKMPDRKQRETKTPNKFKVVTMQEEVSDPGTDISEDEEADVLVQPLTPPRRGKATESGVQLSSQVSTPMGKPKPKPFNPPIKSFR